jgi:hypothetical protein
MAELKLTAMGYECTGCNRIFPMHYKLRDSVNRRQFGRRFVSSLPNVIRHVESCKSK